MDENMSKCVVYTEEAERVYDAEDSLTRSMVGLDKKNWLQFISDVLDDPKWKKVWGKKKLTISIRSTGMRYAYAYVRRGSPTIAIGSANYQRGMHITLHEIAHLIAGQDHQHDEVFCRTLLYLVRRYIGTVYHDKLEKRMYETGALKRPRRKR
jgi:hypothetical protein